MEDGKPILDQVNIVAGDFSRSLDFYRRLGVEFPQPAGGHTGDPFHANGKTPNGFRLELDSAPLRGSGTKAGQRVQTLWAV
jgi:hypothetical protein